MNSTSPAPHTCTRPAATSRSREATSDTDVYALLKAGGGRDRARRAAIELLETTPAGWFAPHTGLLAHLIIDGDSAFVDPAAIEDLEHGAFCLSTGESLVLALALHLMFGRPRVDLHGLAAGVDATYRRAVLTAIEHALGLHPTPARPSEQPRHP